MMIKLNNKFKINLGYKLNQEQLRKNLKKKMLKDLKKIKMIT